MFRRRPDDAIRNRGYRLVVVPILIGIAALAVTHRVEPAGFSLKSLRGPYGCLGALHQDISGNSSELSEVIQLNLDGSGGVTGSLRGQFEGEDCGGAIMSGSTYTVNSDGTGRMTLKLNFTGPDLDGDITDCAMLNSVVVSPEKIDLVLQENGEHFVFAGQDDLLGEASDLGDITAGSFRGSCVSQTKS